MHLIADAERCLISSISVYETAVVLHFRRGPAGIDDLLEYLELMRAELVPFDMAQVHSAPAAYRRFGKGINAESRLNLCDCAAYAWARDLNIPLLFKGHDFRATDIPPVAQRQ